MLNASRVARPLGWLAALLLGAGGVYLSCQSAASAPSKAGGWTGVAIPDAWKRLPSGHSNRGYSWYRCWLQVPKEWQGRSFELFLEPVDDAREAFVNGTRVGGAGDFPPRFRSGLSAPARHKVPAELIKPGQANLLVIRVYREDGRLNFNVAAPVLFGGDEAIRSTGAWQYRAGDDLAWAKPADAPAKANLFAKLEPTEAVNATLKKLAGEDGPLTPAESLKRFKVADDLTLDQVLTEPEVGQPLTFNWDERGRLWVVQYRQYPNPAGLKMVSRDKFLRTVYDKVPPAPPNHDRGRDKITIHEDTNGDGRFDKHKTFVDGLNVVSSAVKGRGGVWILNPPYLLFYPDANDDDVPDGDPEVHLEGFGIEDSHSIASNLTWGPDGWLYAAQGSTVTGHIKRPGQKETVHSMGQLIWRYHPESRRYEIFAEGGGNTFGVEIDAKGRTYSGTNGGNTRGYHYVQGSYSRKGFGKHGALSNPFAYGYFDAMRHHNVPRFTHTFVIYEGAALPKRYLGKLFGVGPLQSHVLYSDFQPDTSTFQTKDLGHPLTSKDTWFRPVHIKVGPDGALYVGDFHEQRIDHASHYQGRVSNDTGRIYRMRAPDAKPIAPFDLGRLSTEKLIAVLKHENKWFRRQALRVFGDRHDKNAIGPLTQAVFKGQGQFALEALWALNLSGGLDEAIAPKLLSHADPYVRLWTVRLLCDDHQVSDSMADKFAQLAAKEPHVECRSQLACSARRLPPAQSLPIVRNLLAHSEDTADRHVPLLLWWALESHTADDSQAVLALFDEPGFWRQLLVREHILERIMRRFAAGGSRRELLACAALLSKAPDREHSAKLMRGFEAAFEGRALRGLPDALIAEIAKVGGVSLALRLRQAEPAAIDEGLQIVANEKAKRADRLQAIEIFGQIRHQPAVDALLAVVAKSKDTAVKSTALNALQAFDDARIVSQVISLHNALPEDARSVAQTLVTSRKPWAVEFVSAAAANRVDPKLVPLPAVRRILLHDDKQLAAQVEKLWGKVQGATTAQMRQRVEELVGVIGGSSGNPYDGKQLYRKTCGKCHRLFEEGGDIGPNLTTFKRDDLRGILLNVVNPSAEIRKGFENYLVITVNGRTVTGFIADQDNQVVVIRGADGQSTVIPRDDIDEMAAVPRSVMPEGILKPLTERQIRDLFAYLRATQPLP